MILDIIGWSSLPDGLLPKWLWFIGLVSVLNNVQAFSSLSDVRRLYSNKPHEVTPLSQRTFALWTFLSSVVRFYGAYHIHVGPIYLIVLWSFVIAWIHFVSEILIFKASRFEGPIIAPCIITTATVAWMIVQSENYIKYAN
ncbi:ergosterol biosynthesis protein [Lunasporangiospora selenospora]|uniref:Ergosterol biosynthesis protein n=1 Tax=Lunasporangiospora selenospora TaxID=979761 RepID=A0A9P6FT58_9FUNG|nr:ergosterol biosynthesis protein [Lunasporangiospora selenospora]